MRVLVARAGEFEREFPFVVARQLLERELAAASAARRRRLLGGAASHAAPALGLEEDQIAPLGPDLPFTVVHGFYWLIANLADEGPLLLAIDDLHWCDEPSLRALAYLRARLSDHPILMVAALRPDEPGTPSLVAAVAGNEEGDRLAPQPLSAGAGSELLEGVFGAMPEPEFVEACVQASGGNPFLLEELGAGLREQGSPPVAAQAEAVRAIAPAAVVRSTLLRIGRLPALCGELAAAIAVIGSEVEPRHAAGLAGVSLEQATPALDELAAGGILAPGLPLRFAHPVVREAVHGEIAPARRAVMHARAASLLAAEGVAPADLAHHLLDSPRAGSAEVVATLRAAAEAMLAQGAPEGALACLERALQEPPEAALTGSLRFEAGRAGWLAGADHPRALEHLRAGFDAAVPGELALRAITLARATATAGDLSGAFEILAAAAARVGEEDAEGVGALRAEQAAIGSLHPDLHDRAAEVLAALPQASPASGSGLAQLAAQAGVAAADGTSEAAAELAEAALADDALLSAEGPDSLSYYVAVITLVFCDRHDLAREQLLQARIHARTRGSVFAFCSVSALSAVLAWRRGETAEALAEARSGIEPGMAPPFTYPLLYSCLALALSDRGELEEAEQAVAATGIGPQLPELLPVNTAFYARGVVRLAQRRWADAREDLLEMGRRDERLGVANPSVPWRPAAVEACMRLGDAALAGELAADEARYAERWGTRTARGQALRAAGLAAGGDGVPALREACAELALSPSRREELLAQIDLGEALRRTGERTEAREVLTAAMELAQGCGAGRLADRAYQELLVAGAKPRRRQFSGLESLTAAERRVAGMAADGSANKEIAESLFLSIRTVENHLSRVYGKLGISSRTDLAESMRPATPGAPED